MESPLVPNYGAGALADLAPSLLAGLDVPGCEASLDLPPARRICLLLVDGLGWHLLRDHADAAPFLSSLATGAAPITAGFPATTATSITAIGTGLPAGEHGIVGYSFRTPDDELVEVLNWRTHRADGSTDLRKRFVPEQAQPSPTVFDRAADAGVSVRLVTARQFEGSGLTRAALRGGEFHGVFALGDLTSAAVDALRTDDRVFCYAYHADLDLLGHVYGPGSAPWRRQLGHVDQLAATIAEALPPDAMLVVTADHGMVAVSEQDLVDFDQSPALADGVRLLGGEPRVRHVYVEQGAADDVLAAWRELLGERAWVSTREQAVEAGWFGPRIADHVLERIGDLVVAGRGNTAIVRLVVEPRLSRLLGQHGSLTADEQLIPLLTARGAALG